MENFFKPPANFLFDSTNLDDAWRRWETQFENYHVACELDKKDKKVQVAILLNAAGPDAQEIHSQFKFSATDDQTDYKLILKKFGEYCKPRKNTVYERYRFWQRDQLEGEPVDRWLKDLKVMSVKCEFGEQVDLMLRDKLVFGVNDDRVRERLLRESEVELSKAVDICRAAESTRLQLKEMSSNANINEMTRDINAVRMRGRASAQETSKAESQKSNTASNDKDYSVQNNNTKMVNDCGYCGRSHPVRKCPAYGKSCNKCSKLNHFSSVCRQSKQVNMIKSGQLRDQDDTFDENELFLGALFVDACQISKDSEFETNMIINGKSVRFKIDTGADGNVLPSDKFHEVCPDSIIRQTPFSLAPFVKGVTVKPLGVTTIDCISENNEQCKVEFFVCKDSHPLLGKATSKALGLVTRNINVAESNGSMTIDDLKARYGSQFKGLGKVGEPYKIHLKPDAKPVVQIPHKIPFVLKDRVKASLAKLEKEDILASVDIPTPWVNNLVITEKKNGNLRYCLDPKPLNEEIMRDHFIMPTPEDVHAKLSGKKKFTVIDMSDAYWHVELDEESSYLTTFHTPWGRKRFKRMPFGLNCASEVLQKRLEDAFGDIEGAYAINDDLIIAGVDDDEHDKVLCAVMDRARERNVKFNMNKIQFKVPSVKYMGHIISEEGLSPDPEKVEAIMNMPVPHDKESLSRFLNVVKYHSQFIPKESMITAPLRALLKQDAEWMWHEVHDNAINKLKSILSSYPVLQFYDLSKPVTIQTDSSKEGIGSVLMQDGHPLHYASRSLIPAESDYPPIEREMLAILYAATKFRQYIYGKHVIVESDHQPLEIITRKPLAKASPRLQYLMMKMFRYSYEVKYVPGSKLFIPDTLSRASLSQKMSPDEMTTDLEVIVHSVVKYFPGTNQRLQEIREATLKDDTMQMLIDAINMGWPKSSHTKLLESYYNIRDEMSTYDGLVLVGSRIVIPEVLRSDMVTLVHESHMGMEKTKSRVRQVIFWPGMSKDIEDKISTCSTCLKFQNANCKEPLMQHEIPELPFLNVAMDFLTFQGEDYLAVVDYYSKFPELCPVKRKTAKCLISHCKSIFARHGIPEIIVADNQPFNSFEFKLFCKSWDIYLITSSPEYPQSNGQAERCVQTLKTFLKKAEDDGGDPYIALLEYRNTPISGMQYAPAQLAMSRLLRSRIPVTHAALKPVVVLDAHKQLVDRQAKYKQHYDKHAHSLPELNSGDIIRVRRNQRWEPGFVEAQHASPRSYVIRTENGGRLRRNRRHLMKTNEPLTNMAPDEIQLPEYSTSDSRSAVGPADIQENTPDILPLKKGTTFRSEVASQPRRSERLSLKKAVHYT